MNKEAIEAVKKEMEYSDGTDCCRTCLYFTPTDLSGSYNAKSAHCHRNVFTFDVSEAGRCKVYELKK
jgi:hypothetical protein